MERGEALGSGDADVRITDSEACRVWGYEDSWSFLAKANKTAFAEMEDPRRLMILDPLDYRLCRVCVRICVCMCIHIHT